ncbi:hypothetical protein [Carboxylicivirga marina]|uniref:Carboxypeptidase regulatory-like domain-containing protein n=1 Tax=Carboxylicivirga marina TaxID=2800988 RepID=A0ABS1HNA4_9BACT|nr:hypothetical protein [Carboxylicivirga marina]MBK3519156.1 hypothetical protein [Carboxylicivirga marina]
MISVLNKYSKKTGEICYKLLIASVLIFSSCEKVEGPGGMAKITGKVIIEDYNSDFTVLRDVYPAQAYDVYLIYGNDSFYGDRIKTSYDGYFEFDFLREGDYTVFVYSKDKSFDYNSTSEKIPVFRNVKILSKRQVLEVNDLIVVK